MVPVLPLDIHTLVIEWVYKASQYTAVDHRTLRICALVCRAWTSIAQRLLFRTLPYPDFSDGHGDTSPPVLSLLRTIRASPRLAEHVTAVNLKLCRPRVYPSDGVNRVALLELCPNVKCINILGDIWGDTLDAYEARLRALPILPTFLSIKGWYTEVARIVHIWPSLPSRWTCF
ncbi:hypothetical protein FA95DRAFT_1367147 [Auriscalpium vulgare]|uniref:Uncharacterized protein n=1 Tax=Auriscalpium vulgare TaxID=40419 RepID=A0ACB8R141_9AGAM|nr:hypothetical protein FA95DRAFT_1367147 [Auriscalpium vulgare]